MTELDDLNKARRTPFRKKKEEEEFLDEMNEYLFQKEQTEYRDYPVEHPFLFVVGLPRSGTTLTAQVIADSFRIGYIDNVAARFYRAPLHGVRFSRALLGDRRRSTFRSNYATTENLSDIHEYGYFWRHWLKKNSLEEIAASDTMEEKIDWAGLRKCLGTLQREFGEPMVFKNLFGAYHMQKLTETLGKVLFIEVERDELDVACSILKARRKFYGDDLHHWWSAAPPEVLELRNLEPRKQIAGQVVCLKRMYERQFQRLAPENRLSIRYELLCKAPGEVIDTLRNHVKRSFDSRLVVENRPPDRFELQTHDDKADEKKRFRKLIDQFREQLKAKGN